MSADLRYQPSLPVAVDLGDNTSLWGTPPAARAAIAAAAAEGVSRYPSAYGERFKAAAADYLGVQASQVLTGCGSDDVLDATIRAASRPGGRLAFSAPTFSMIPVFGAVNRLECIAVPFAADWDLDVERLLAADAAITFICAPNNPTGTAASREAIEAVVAGASGLVIIDEAYAEYAGTTAVDLLARSDQLLIVRTMSKAFGLAGQRIGYAAGAPGLVAAIEGVRGPFKLTTASEAAAVAAFADDLPWVQARVVETLELRARFEAAVAGTSAWELLPSCANFVLARPSPGSPDTPAALDARLRARGVAGRLFANLPGIGDAYRITIGPWAMLEPVVDAMVSGGRR